MHYSDPVVFDNLTTTHLSWYLDNAGIRNLASLMTSFNRLGYCPSSAFFEAVSSRSEELLLCDDPEAIALLSYGLSSSPSHALSPAALYSLSAYFTELVGRSSDLIGILGDEEGGGEGGAGLGRAERSDLLLRAPRRSCATPAKLLTAPCPPPPRGGGL